MSRIGKDEFLKLVGIAGLAVGKWAPGDGATRYRFFESSASGIDRDTGQVHDVHGDYHEGDGIYTALGTAEAVAFVRGYIAGKTRGGGVGGVGGHYKQALIDLLEFAKGNRGSREGNPYLKPEVKAAVAVLEGQGQLESAGTGRRTDDLVYRGYTIRAAPDGVWIRNADGRIQRADSLGHAQRLVDAMMGD